MIVFLSNLLPSPKSKSYPVLRPLSCKWRVSPIDSPYSSFMFVPICRRPVDPSPYIDRLTVTDFMGRLLKPIRRQALRSIPVARCASPSRAEPCRRRPRRCRRRRGGDRSCLGEKRLPARGEKVGRWVSGSKGIKRFLYTV